MQNWGPPETLVVEDPPSLERAPDALNDIMNRKVRGKVVLAAS